MRIIYLTLLLIILAGEASAQDTIVLPSFELVDSTGPQLSSAYELSLPKATLLQPAQTLANVLEMHSGVSMRIQAPGMLSTAGIRGGDAQHTLLVWNGVRINSPMLGSNDLGLIPTTGLTSAALVTGVATNVYAGGGLGGAIVMETAPSLGENSVRASATAGSFGFYDAHTSFAVHLPFILGLDVRVSTSAAAWKNDFPYTDIFQQPFTRRVMQHASGSRINDQIDLRWQLSGSVYLQVAAWNTNASRELPSTISTAVPSQQTQQDTAVRGMIKLGWSPTERWLIEAQLFQERNINRFEDEVTGIRNRNVFANRQFHLGIQRFFRRGTHIRYTLQPMHWQGSSGNYSSRIKLWYWSQNMQLTQPLLKRKIQMELGLRHEIFQRQSVLLPYAGSSLWLNRSWGLSWVTSAAMTNRMPTINELYWQPGGNPDLKSERGQFAETGLRLQRGAWQAEAVVYAGEYENRIRWLPEGNVFKPQNIAESTVYGVDARGKYRRSWKELVLDLHANGTYCTTSGTLKGASEEFDLSYVPKYAGSAGLSIRWKTIGASYDHRYTGLRYITNDESAYMPAYSLANASLRWNHSTFPVSLQLQVNNIWDTGYQNLPWRPMPGRWWQFSIEFFSKW